jgi:Rrf2 family protein
LSELHCAFRSTPEIARCAGIPSPYLAKIINLLARHDLVKARRGVGGGVSLAREPDQITLLQIVRAVEGEKWLGECLLGLDECSDVSTCPTHPFWLRIRSEITEELAKTTLASVIRARTSGSVGKCQLVETTTNKHKPMKDRDSANMNTKPSRNLKRKSAGDALGLGVILMTGVSMPDLLAYRPSATATGNSCSVCHGSAGGGRTVSGLLAISETTKLTDLGKQLGGQTRGPLYTFDALPGTTVELSVDVLSTPNLIGSASYALQLKRLEMSGQQLSTNNFLSWTDANPEGSGWVKQDDPVVPAGVTNPYFTKDLAPNQTGTFKFLLGLKPETPVDVYDLEFAIAGVDDGGMFYYDRHFYVAVIAPELLTDQAVTWSQALSAAGYVLQVADSPEGPWQNYTGGTAIIDGNNVALMHVSSGSKKFFRLHKP